MFVLPLAGLSAARCIPKYETAMRSGALVRYDALDRNSAFVVFVSHRWVNESSMGRPGFRQYEGGGGREDGTPDVESAKHAFLVEGLNSILASLPREVAVFLWIDFSCIDQVRREGTSCTCVYLMIKDMDKKRNLARDIEGFFQSQHHSLNMLCLIIIFQGLLGRISSYLNLIP